MNTSPEYEKAKRHSMLMNSDRTPVFARYMNSTMSKSLRSLNMIDLSDRGDVGTGSVMSMSLAHERAADKADALLLESSARGGATRRPLNRYQKSITCDLSDYILGSAILFFVLSTFKCFKTKYKFNKFKHLVLTT